MSAVLDEVKEIRQLARQFASEELRPHVERWDHEGAIDDAVRAQLAELGFAGMRVPEAAGGMGMGQGVWAAAMQELAWGEPSVAVAAVQAAFAADLMLAAGSDAQRQEWAGRVAGGEAALCVALAEEDAGSDLGAIETRAEEDGDGWTLTGEKRWVTEPSRAAAAVVLAVTDAGPTLFLVPTTAHGFRVGVRDTTLGLRPLELATVHLEAVRVERAAIVGEAGGAAALLTAAAEAQRIGVAAVAVGIARAALEHAVGYAAVREQFGTAIRTFQGIQFKLAEMATRTEAAEALLRHVIAEPAPGRAEMAKVFASETAMAVTTDAVQVFGGYGYMRDYPVEKLMRDAKATELLAGASALLRVRIAESLYP